MEIKSYINLLKEELRSARGRNVLTFLVFLAISTVFWFLLALNDDVQKDYTLPVTLDDFPKDVTLLSGYNTSLSITIKDKGSSLMKYGWGNTPTMKLRFNDFTKQNDTLLLLTSAQLNSAIRGMFGSSATIVAMRPDSLRISYTKRPGVRVPISVKSEIHTLPQYAYAGHPITSVDSVWVYSNSSRRNRIHAITTKSIVLSDLTDTTTMEVALDVPNGMRAVPPTVKVTFPVEPLVTKHQSLPVVVQNVPRGEKVVTFPSMVDVSYLIPKSMYGQGNAPIKATVNYHSIKSNTKKLSISLSKLSPQYRNVTVEPAEVEFVIEKEN